MYVHTYLGSVERVKYGIVNDTLNVKYEML